jgi:prepilin-type N-terminal cleavage/methylation domain-containing protein
MSKNIRSHSGFTLIEILIVVAIIAILSSVVLIGLGPTQKSGRDARRLSDLHEVQTGLELYYGKCGFYPSTTLNGGCPLTCNSAVGYKDMSTALTGSGIGVSSVPQDPVSGHTYYYGTDQNCSKYLLMAKLENKDNSVFVNYTAPSSTDFRGDFSTADIDCSTSTTPNYCLAL